MNRPHNRPPPAATPAPTPAVRALSAGKRAALEQALAVGDTHALRALAGVRPGSLDWAQPADAAAKLLAPPPAPVTAGASSLFDRVIPDNGANGALRGRR